MAIFDLKTVFDPLADEFREGYQEVLARLNVIGGHLELQNELTQTTNRLLAVLVEQGSKPTAKATAAKAAADRRAQ